MAVKTSWRRYGTKLRHCHPMYSRVAILSAEISRCQKRLRDVRVVEEHDEGCDGPASIEPLFVAANSCCPAVMVFSRSVHTFHEACNSGITWQTDRQTDRLAQWNCLQRIIRSGVSYIGYRALTESYENLPRNATAKQFAEWWQQTRLDYTGRQAGRRPTLIFMAVSKAANRHAGGRQAAYSKSMFLM